MLTEEQRKENAKSMITYLSTVAGIFGGYVGAQAGGIMLEQGVDFLDTFGIMANSFANLDFFPPFNTMSFIGGIAGFGAVAAASYFFLKTDNERNYSYKLDEVAGTGGFMNEKQKKEFLAQFEKEPEKPGEPSPNMILGQTARRPNNSRLMIGNNNIAVIGGAGTGKSRFVIKPNLLTLNSSFVITDPSGEIINSLGKVLNDHGYKIKIFNISDEEGTYDIWITADQFLPYKGTLVIAANQVVNINATLERAAGVCQIGDKYYLTVGEAIQNAKNGDTIVVMTSSTEDKPLVVPKEKQLTIMSEFPVNITRKETSLDDMLTNHGTLTIHGPVNFHYSSSGNTLLRNYGTVTLSSGVTFTSHYSHGKVIRNKGRLILEGSGDEYQCIIKGIGQNSNFGLWNEGVVQTNNCQFLIQDVSYGVVQDGNGTDDISTNYHYINVGQPFYGM